MDRTRPPQIWLGLTPPILNTFLPFASRRGRVRSTQGMPEIHRNAPNPQQPSPLPRATAPPQSERNACTPHRQTNPPLRSAKGTRAKHAGDARNPPQRPKPTTTVPLPRATTPPLPRGDQEGAAGEGPGRQGASVIHAEQPSFPRTNRHSREATVIPADAGTQRKQNPSFKIPHILVQNRTPWASRGRVVHGLPTGQRDCGSCQRYASDQYENQ